MKRILLSIVCNLTSACFFSGCTNPAATVQYVQPHISIPPGASRIVVTNTCNYIDLLLFDNSDVLQDGKVLPKQMYLFTPCSVSLFWPARNNWWGTWMEGGFTVLTGETENDLIHQLRSTSFWRVARDEKDKVVPVGWNDKLQRWHGGSVPPSVLMQGPVPKFVGGYNSQQLMPKFRYKITGKPEKYLYNQGHSIQTIQEITATPIQVDPNMDEKDQAAFFHEAQLLHIFGQGNQIALVGGKNQVVWDRLPGDLVITFCAKLNIFKDSPASIQESDKINTEPGRTYYFIFYESSGHARHIRLDRVE